MKRVAMFGVTVLLGVLLSHELSLSLPIFGVGPDVLIVGLVAFVNGERPTTAATYGFVAGLIRDMLLLSPKGISAFAYALTAYALGLAGEVRAVWGIIGMVSGATLVSQVVYGLAALVLSQNASVASLPRVALATTAYNTVLAPLLMPLLRRFIVSAKQVREGGTAP